MTIKPFEESLKKASAKNQSVITLLTDFGNENGFVGVMKGVILQIAPSARIIDVTHDLPPFSISAALFLNEWCYSYFPAGSVHLCIVDPGVGSQRRVLIAELDGHQFAAPDNGLLTPILKRKAAKVYHATNDRYWLDKISNTFHGRDIFSPLAAHLANGVAAAEMGAPLQNPILLHIEPPKINPLSIDCHVRYIDRFGNLITDLDQESYKEWRNHNGCSEKETLVLFQDQRIEGLSRSYAEKNQGEILAVFDGYDRLEIAIAGGNAAATTGLGFDALIKICVTGAE
ncbi:MAG: SAM-dependent chlorinase/fluorinase [Candidatus Omnitrophica bacterium]|nr:SAM-dependent chlorinase/fluorinase [Candidatus Omnitrophota bacterium]